MPLADSDYDSGSSSGRDSDAIADEDHESLVLMGRPLPVHWTIDRSDSGRWRRPRPNRNTSTQGQAQSPCEWRLLPGPQNLLRVEGRCSESAAAKCCQWCCRARMQRHQTLTRSRRRLQRGGRRAAPGRGPDQIIRVPVRVRHPESWSPAPDRVSMLAGREPVRQ